MTHNADRLSLCFKRREEKKIFLVFLLYSPLFFFPLRLPSSGGTGKRRGVYRSSLAALSLSLLFVLHGSVLHHFHPVRQGFTQVSRRGAVVVVHLHFPKASKPKTKRLESRLFAYSLFCLVGTHACATQSLLITKNHAFACKFNSSQSAAHERPSTFNCPQVCTLSPRTVPGTHSHSLSGRSKPN